MSAIDPGTDLMRDEAEARLARLRPALQLGGVVEEFVATLAQHGDRRQDIQHALLKPNAAWQPRTCLDAPVTQKLDARVADAVFAMDMNLRVDNCVPIKGTNCVAMVGFPASKLPEPRLLLHFPRHRVGGATDARVEMRRGGANELRISVMLRPGAHRAVSASGIDAEVLDRLFATLPRAAEASCPLPDLPGELPVQIGVAVGDFWQTHLRAHVIPTAVAPEGATRPLAFESVKASHESHRNSSKATVQAIVHGSSMRCACGLHGLDPMRDRYPLERWAESEVQFTLSMCGRDLYRDADGLCGACPFHADDVETNDLLPGICCVGTEARVACMHFTSGRKKRKAGLYIPKIPLHGETRARAQVLIATAHRAARKTEPLLGKRNRDDLRHVCTQVSIVAENRLDELGRRFEDDATRGKRTPEAMLELDMAAVDALRANETWRMARRCSGKDALVRIGADGEVVPVTKADYEKGLAPPPELAETHIGFFKPLPPRARK